jgi:DNA-binding response OmpR family regulator
MIRRTSSVPIIMLTARDMVEDKVQGFELGADDYVVKPFEPKELIVRIRARLKGDTARGSIESGVLKVDNIIVNINKYEVISDGEVVDLKPKEIQLLYFLLNNRNIVFSRDNLLEKVWSYEFAGDTRTVDVHIKRLREKLEKPGTSWGIKTVWGVGYKLEVK